MEIVKDLKKEKKKNLLINKVLNNNKANCKTTPATHVASSKSSKSSLPHIY